MSKKRKALGRGLGALLGDTSPTRQDKGAAANANEIPLNQIEVNPFQPRRHFDQEALDGLAQSIQIHGIIQPITVRRLADSRYQLIAGERRYHATKRAGLTMVPAHIRTADDQQMLEMALIENIQREHLNPIEIALSYQRLISEINLKQEELGNRVGKKRATVTNYLRLLKLPPIIQAALRDEKITMGHARALVNAGTIDTQLHIFEKTVSDRLSVRQTEELTRHLIAASTWTEHSPTGKGKQPGGTRETNEVIQLSSKLSTHFGTKVGIKMKGNKGEIRVPFLSIDDLNRILAILNI